MRSVEMSGKAEGLIQLGVLGGTLFADLAKDEKAGSTHQGMSSEHKHLVNSTAGGLGKFF